MQTYSPSDEAAGASVHRSDLGADQQSRSFCTGTKRSTIVAVHAPHVSSAISQGDRNARRAADDRSRAECDMRGRKDGTS